MFGKEIRMKRLFDKESGKVIFVPLDHGATMGPVKGIERIPKLLSELEIPYVNGIVLCKGHFADREVVENCDIPKILHLSNSNRLSMHPDSKILVGSVEQAIALGADAVSVHVNMGSENEYIMLNDFAKVSEACTRWGIPLLAMMYYRPADKKYDKTAIKVIARLAQEMGADIVKVDYTGDMDSFSEVIQGCSIPVIISGGEKDTPKHALKNAYEAIKCGVAGVAFGRNIFQYENPKKLTKALSFVVHRGMDVDTALERAIEVSENK